MNSPNYIGIFYKYIFKSLIIRAINFFKFNVESNDFLNSVKHLCRRIVKIVYANHIITGINKFNYGVRANVSGGSGN